MGKQGTEKEITSEDLFLSVFMLGTGCSSTEPSELRSFMQAHARTHAQDCCTTYYSVVPRLLTKKGHELGGKELQVFLFFDNFFFFW